MHSKGEINLTDGLRTGSAPASQLSSVLALMFLTALYIYFLDTKTLLLLA